ncbi:MAG: two-component system response regulator [Chlamydiae bacterium RIFCSPHIGHO2_12_FULL_44_59]|nr:MAG: two-component system response regulator [Chlamydiae bacterium RIFCSPHIGHO2_01_FULL_44_39]OGN58854.1 MAG: two-component system response regulator [Chlamydiae bacterium RIFCSPHIGHO2_02_FULL_45_9]OGN60044.1 MAG: two-component system response regulator [Chlamydiae bacterium RIFCSPHIGHO2_12_FULL_44_59]OGN66217.1 MAG: two-component system response regulator [Chlamydiae bacterium RIFCSPLOWO2_01_FULL_44_52]OGN68489.1 MAG: two-component system response regulator [Chlamydiae bacterium RIFCSPLOWO2
MIEKILIVDDDPILLKFMVEVVKRQGKEAATASDGEEAIDILKNESVDLVITDMKMPKKNGLEVLKQALQALPSPLVVIATAHGTVESAVEAMRLGAFHYLIKPFSPDALKSVLNKAEAHARLVHEHRYYKEGSKFPPLVAESPAMKYLLKDLKKIAKAQASVFITGESGTGKEVIAGTIHEFSERAKHPFIKVNCAAIPETLLESEFFGHERGSFTGAHTKKTGRFELADRGTLLLDEVTEIPLMLQPKLLRALQEQEFERVGGTRPIKVNVRFLATSNRNMQEAIESKVFREDLYYRLNVVPIHLPPLRERKEDILPLAHHFLGKFCLENHKEKKTLTEKAMEKLQAYSWPGNVRELANIIERTVVLDFDTVIDSSHLYLDNTTAIPSNTYKKGMKLHEMEKKLILETLEANFQNRTKTAESLGISIRTLRNKLSEYEETP